MLQGDAQQLLVDEVAFDMVIFNLILISDGAACLRDNLRALKHGGRVIVFDKILRDTGRLILGRRLLNLGGCFQIGVIKKHRKQLRNE